MVLLNVDGKTVTDSRQIVSSMLDKLLRDDCLANENEQHSDIRRFPEREILALDVIPATDQELRTAIFKQKNGKALGCDGIKAEIIKRSYNRIGPFFMHIANHVFRQAEFPVYGNMGLLRFSCKAKTSQEILNLVNQLLCCQLWGT